MESQAESSIIKSVAPGSAKEEGSTSAEEAKNKDVKTSAAEPKISTRPDNQAPTPKGEKEETKDADEPFPRSWMQRNILSAVRPLITLLLTATFIYLIIHPLLTLIIKLNTVKTSAELTIVWAEITKYMDKILPIFLAVYGPIIGFWFGEKTALKVPGKSG